MHNLYVVNVQDKEWELTQSYEAFFSRADLDNLFHWTPSEGELVHGNIDLDLSAMSFTSLLQQFCKAEKAFVEANPLLALGLFLLKLIHLVHLMATTFEVDILSCNTRLFVELNIKSGLIADEYWLL